MHLVNFHLASWNVTFRPIQPSDLTRPPGRRNRGPPPKPPTIDGVNSSVNFEGEKAGELRRTSAFRRDEDVVTCACCALQGEMASSRAPPLPRTTFRTQVAKSVQKEKLGIRVLRQGERIDVESLRDLFASVGFPPRDPLRLQQAVEDSLSVSALVCRTTGRVRAFARAAEEDRRRCKSFSDKLWMGSLHAKERLELAEEELEVLEDEFNRVVTIWDVAVAPDWQRQGLGRMVMERLLDDLEEKGVDRILLQAEPEAIDFYARLGFVLDETVPTYLPPLDRGKGMSLR